MLNMLWCENTCDECLSPTGPGHENCQSRMLRAVINLTQHEATPEQQDADVVDLPAESRQELIGLLTFDSLPNAGEVAERAEAIAAMAQKFVGGGQCAASQAADLGACEECPHGCVRRVMIGGASFLMGSLERALLPQGIEPLYAFSARESVEETLADGSVRKTAVFRHRGFVSAAR